MPSYNLCVRTPYRWTLYTFFSLFAGQVEDARKKGRAAMWVSVAGIIITALLVIIAVSDSVVLRVEDDRYDQDTQYAQEAQWPEWHNTQNAQYQNIRSSSDNNADIQEACGKHSSFSDFTGSYTQTDEAASQQSLLGWVLDTGARVTDRVTDVIGNQLSGK